MGRRGWRGRPGRLRGEARCSPARSSAARLGALLGVASFVSRGFMLSTVEWAGSGSKGV